MDRMLDPREEIIRKRLGKIKKIIVLSPKGGVGKTVISCALAVSLSKIVKVGLLDLDISSPCCHIVLGISTDVFPEENKGILPVEMNNLKFMSTVFFTKNKALALRGKYKTEVFLEILSVTNWKDVDTIIIDTPPGLDDTFLNILRYLENKMFLIVSTPDNLAVMSLRRSLMLINKREILGLIENMSNKENLQDFCKKIGVRYLGKIFYFQNIHEWYGERFWRSPLVSEMENIVLKFKKDILD